MGSATAARFPPLVERHHDESEWFHMKRRLGVVPSKATTRSGREATGVVVEFLLPTASTPKISDLMSQELVPDHIPVRPQKRKSQCILLSREEKGNKKI
ncbi:hypothetical protein YC2023_019402 [Brassica napus]